MDNQTLDQLASDYEADLQQRERNALKALLGVIVLVFGTLAVMGPFGHLSSEARLIQILVLAAILSLVVFALIRSSRQLLTNPHPLTKLVSQSDTPAFIRMHLELSGRAKRHAESQLYFRASKFGDEQARAYFRGDSWEEMPAGAAIPYEQLIDAPNLNLLANQPGWARWALRPFLVSASIVIMLVVLFSIELLTKLNDGGMAQAFVGQLATITAVLALSFGGVFALGDTVSDLQLARKPTSELIDLWLTGDYRALKRLRMRERKDPEAKVFLARLA